MRPLTRPLVRFPLSWLLLACAAVTASWIVTQGPRGARAPRLSTLAVMPGNTLPHITEERAIAIALNDFEVSPGEIRLRHPRHQAAFTEQGVTFTPLSGGPAWTWQLSQVKLGDELLAGVELAGVSPALAAQGTVRFDRGPVVEQYVAQANSLEQQFLLPERLAPGDGDLVISGAVTSAGQFAAQETGWRWSTPTGEVHLGQVYVFDAAGVELPATMHVTPTQTEIRVAGSHLAQASYPVTIDPEIGANDFRLSDMGGDTFFDAFRPAVVYNPDLDEYLVVWDGDDNTGSLVDEESEIFAQRVAGATGAEIGGDLRLSDMGPDGDPEYDAFNPSVAYNPTQETYLVVWQGDDDTGPLVDGENEIFGQLVEADTGAQIGGDLRLSDMGPDSDPDYDAFTPAVAYNPTLDEYLVIWHGDDDTGLLVNGENEIFGQRVAGATGIEVGTNDFRLSDMGPDGDLGYDAFNPAVAYNPALDEYLVVWWGDDDTGSLVNNEFEIFGQRVAGATGAESGTNDFRLSDMGPDGDPDYDATNPAVAYNPTQDVYLVVWSGDDDTSPLVEGENEVFGQLVEAATGAEIGGDLRLSDLGPDGDPDYDALDPAVVFNPTLDEFLVVWWGDDDTNPQVDEESEIFGQRVAGATGAEIGSDLRLSDMGLDGDPDYDASSPAVAYNPTQDEYLVVWDGDDDTSPLVDEEREIYGQRVAGGTGTESGVNDFRLSDMGPDGDPAYGGAHPAVAYNATRDEYLVVWWGDDNTSPLVNNEAEIFGQRVAGATGAEIGDDLRLSDMGPDGDPDYNAFYPAVAYNPTQDEYLVVWSGDDDTGSLVDNEFEIFGQRVAGATGAQIGSDLRLSDMGPDGDPDYAGLFPTVAYNATQDEYLVIWSGDVDTGSLVDNEFEIFGQRVAGATGVEIGSNDFRLSDMGLDGDPAYDATGPAVAYNSTQDEYLVVWWGDDIGSLVDNEFEIFGQRVAGATGAEIGGDLRLSDMGPDGDPTYHALLPAVAYNPTWDEYLVVWHGDDDTGSLVDNEFEIFGQRVAGATGAEIGINDFRLSDMGPDGDPLYAARHPAVTYNPIQDEYLVVWHGDDDTGSLVDEEFEIFGQRVAGATGAEIGGDLRLSDMGPDGDPNYAADFPAAAYNPTQNEYLLVWYGDDNTGPLVNNEFEIFGQRFAPDFNLYLPVIRRE